jgi:K+-sensing histidine kinase KdpD
MHELKTPLTVVSLALSSRSHREENLQHASRAVHDMKAIIDRCVEADQMGQLTLERRPQEIDTSGLLNNWAEQIPGLSSRFVLQAEAGLPRLLTDLQLLQIVLNNLLDNANRYSDPLTPVTVTVSQSLNENVNGLRICVSNTPGLASWPDAEMVFSKYYRASGRKNVHLGKAVFRKVSCVATRHSDNSQPVLDQEGCVESDKQEPEVPLA